MSLLAFREFDVHVKLLEQMLGTVPKNKEVYASHIANKGREQLLKNAGKGLKNASGEELTPETTEVMLQEEVETIQEVEERGWTGFHTDEQGPFVFDYFVKGTLCEAARTIAKQIEKEHGLKQLQDKVKRFLFVSPRRIRLPAIEEKPLERPLRAMTAQGPRVTVVRSDSIAAESEFTFRIRLLDGSGLTPTIIQKILAYGELIGFGQWRTGSYGRYSVVSFKEV